MLYVRASVKKLDTLLPTVLAMPRTSSTALPAVNVADEPRAPVLVMHGDVGREQAGGQDVSRTCQGERRLLQP